MVSKTLKYPGTKEPALVRPEKAFFTKFLLSGSAK
jgi:hypothetical protein